MSCYLRCEQVVVVSVSQSVSLVVVHDGENRIKVPGVLAAELVDKHIIFILYGGREPAIALEWCEQLSQWQSEVPIWFPAHCE